MTASPATGAFVSARFDAGRVVVSGPAGTTPLFVWDQGAGSVTLSVGGSLVSGAAPTVLAATLRCVNDYSQSDVASNSSCL